MGHSWLQLRIGIQTIHKTEEYAPGAYGSAEQQRDRWQVGVWEMRFGSKDRPGPPESCRESMPINLYLSFHHRPFSMRMVCRN